MVQFKASSLLYKRQFRYLTGVTPDIFQQMAQRLRPLWEGLCQRKNRAGHPWGVGGLEDHLLVMLILYRCHITQDFLGLLYGVDKATVSRALRRIEPLAKRVLGVKRSIRVTAEEAQALLIDATEQPVQRPERNQKCWYSGKKKRHCIKNEIIHPLISRTKNRKKESSQKKKKATTTPSHAFACASNTPSAA